MTYQYQPLERHQEEIRLVSLLPGSFNDPIKICIRHSVLTPCSDSNGKENDRSERKSLVYPWTAEETSDGETLIVNRETNETTWHRPIPADEDYSPQTDFEALSYTWGTPDSPETARVMQNESGEEDCATILIYQNLATALRYIRHRDRHRTLWVDAICINQEDIPERNSQVKRMASIYRSAYRVIAWLGIGDLDSTQAIDTLRYIGEQLVALKTGRIVSAPGAREPDLWMNACCFIFDDQMWHAILNLLERSWFYRLWCWQEINLSSRRTYLQCGHDLIGWRVFWRAVICIHNKERLPSVIFRERCRHIAFLTADVKQHPMSTMLDLGRSKGCADPRDKVYGLLGLTAPLFNASVKTDYSLPVEKVYKEAFLAHADITKRLELLKHCVLAKRTTGGPSWVPDWSKTEFTAPILSEQLSAGLSETHIKYTPPDVLQAVGIRCTTVQKVGAASSSDIDKALAVVPKWLELVAGSEQYINRQTMIEALALTLTMNRTRERHPTNHFLSVSESVDLLRDILTLDADSDEEHPIFSNREVGNIIQKIRGRAFFITNEGHMGTAPDGVRPGDHVCILLGCYSPIIIRTTDNDQHQVVGEAYIHGFEDAKAILGSLPPPWRAIIKGDDTFGRPLHRYLNLNTGEVAAEDPRLDILPPPWVRWVYERAPDDPALFEVFRNTATGETMKSDPRLSAEALKARGVQLKTFDLI
ncbi:MAG: hypothetical protein Q9208_004820 [Pyrenodesmia sp. 3 TL-2023]